MKKRKLLSRLWLLLTWSGSPTHFHRGFGKLTALDPNQADHLRSRDRDPRHPHRDGRTTTTTTMPTIQCHRHVVVLLEASGRVEVTQSAPISQNMYWNRLQQALSSAHLTLPDCRAPQFHQAQLSRPPVVSRCEDVKISTIIGCTFKRFLQELVLLSNYFHKYWFHFQKISTSIGCTFKRYPQVLAELSKDFHKYWLHFQKPSIRYCL